MYGFCTHSLMVMEFIIPTKNPVTASDECWDRILRIVSEICSSLEAMLSDNISVTSHVNQLFFQFLEEKIEKKYHGEAYKAIYIITLSTMDMFNGTMNGMMGMMGMNPMGMHGMGMHGMGGMYGGNFIDVLFRHMMEKGWEGITCAAIFNLYMYLSLDKMKGLFLYINNYLAQNGSTYFEYYSSTIIEKSKTISKDYLLSLLELCKRIALRRIQPIQKKGEDVPEQSTLNRVSVTLNASNKTDLMALGGFLLKIKESSNSFNYTRQSSDKYKTSELYVLPDTIVFGIDALKETNLTAVKAVNLSSDITIKLEQNVNYKLVCETDDRIEILKDIIVKTPEKDKIIKMSSDAFNDLSKTVLKMPKVNCPSFHSECGWSSRPESFYNGAMKEILFYLYYTKNFNLFKQFYKFGNGEGTFWFNKRNYQLLDSCPASKFKESDRMSKLMAQLEIYCDKELIPKTKSDAIDSWISTNHSVFEPVTDMKPCMTLSFESKLMEEDELSLYSRWFLNTILTDYYNQNVDRIGNKISIYQLNIQYKITTEKTDNPAYIEYIAKNGKPEEAKAPEKKEPEKKDAEKNKGSPVPVRANVPVRSNVPAPAYNYSYKPIPEQFIETIVKIPKVKSIHIKSDRKPFEYLYLQRFQKELLESYLSNFKNNKELYEKMGIAYKSGLILSSVPGCGKSSSIVAIATYLNTDIYYLDLGKIMTNHELKLCIDYIKVNSQKGILIFEDIDCMTPIVKRRTTIDGDYDYDAVKHSKLNLQENNDALSLSYLLNVLDGTLSPENIMFIMTTNHKEVLDPALFRPGRIDIDIHIDKCSSYQLEEIYHDLYHRYLSKEIVNRFKEYHFATAEVILHLFHNVYNMDVTEEQLLEKFLIN